MMDCTDRHDRYFLRLMSKNVMLYSEMVATKSAIHGDRKKILSYSPEEKPLALQVGGSDKAELAEVAKIAEDMGYDEININLGCPSKKVQKNMFGACLMKEPDLVTECINSMVNACKIPVTAKTRIGFDDTEEFDYLNNFILKMKGVGCSTFILHARKAVLTGMSPKQNLNIPKLNYGMVYKIKEENPEKNSKWNGECFVFDSRVSVKHGLEEGIYNLCYACRMPLAPDDFKKEEFEKGVSCHLCIDSNDDERKERFRERQYQVELADKRGKHHIG